jgi:hypothetical protein
MPFTPNIPASYKWQRYFISANFTVSGAIKTNKQQETENE